MTNVECITRASFVLFCILFCVSCRSSEGLVIHSQNSSLYLRTPAFIRWHDSPFEVTAAVVTLEAKEDCDYPGRLQGQILMTSREDIEKFCGFVEARDHFVFAIKHGSVGLIHFSTFNQHLMDFIALKLSPPPFYHIGPIPAVAASVETAQEILFLLRASNARPLNVTLSSADPNTAVNLIKSPWIILLFTAAGLLSAFNTYGSIVKAVMSKLGDSESLSVVMWLILVPEIIANSARLILSVNTVVFVEGAVNWQIYRILASISVPLGFTSTIAVSYGLNEAYRKSKGGATKTKSKILRFFVSLFFGISALVVLVDIALTILAAFYGEVLSVDGLALFHAVVQLPLIYFFLVYGTRVSNTLMAAKHNVDKMSLERVQNFVHRVRLSGVALILNLANMVIFATMGGMSFSYWYIPFGFLLNTWGWVSFFQIAAVKPAMKKSPILKSSFLNRPSIAPAVR